MITEKEYALEQLNITALQIDALKQTVSVFKTFNSRNNYQKIEELQNQYEELTDDLTDINSLFENQPFIDIDESELEQDLDDLEKKIHVEQLPVATINSMPQVPDNTIQYQTTAELNKEEPRLL